MKKTALLISALTLGSILGAAEAPKLAYSVTLDFPYVSKYVFRGQELSKDAIQPSVELAVGDFYAGIWTSQPVVNNTDNEFDFYVGQKLKLNDAWSLDVGATAYYYPELDRTSGLDRQTYEGYVGVVGNVKGFSPGAYVYYDFTLKALTVQGQLGYSLALSEPGASMDFNVTLGNVSPDVGSSYMYYSVGVTVPYKLTDKATVYAGVSYNNNDLDGAKGDITVFTVGCSIGF